MSGIIRTYNPGALIPLQEIDAALAEIPAGFLDMPDVLFKEREQWLEVTSDATLQEYAAYGLRLGRQWRSHRWHIIDYCNYGCKRFGWTKQEAAEIVSHILAYGVGGFEAFQIDTHTIQNWLSTGAHFPPHARHLQLTFQHHEYAKELPPDLAQHYLKLAVKEGLSAAAMRRRMTDDITARSAAAAFKQPLGLISPAQPAAGTQTTPAPRYPTAATQGVSAQEMVDAFMDGLPPAPAGSGVTVIPPPAADEPEEYTILGYPRTVTLSFPASRTLAALVARANTPVPGELVEPVAAEDVVEWLIYKAAEELGISIEGGGETEE